MRGNYNMRISEMKTGGLKIRIENLKTEKVANFEASKKAILNGKLSGFHHKPEMTTGGFTARNRRNAS